MAIDFWAGYLSGVASILIGNPLDVLKVQLQNGRSLSLANATPPGLAKLSSASTAVKGSAAPILGYGGLNGLLFVAYNRALMNLDPKVTDTTNVPETSLLKIWTAGAVGGAASWIVSAPTELIKCRTQLSTQPRTSWSVAREVWTQVGLRGFYLAGPVTLVRDSVGYGFYFGSYEFSKRTFTTAQNSGVETLLCGGVAGVATWASIYPLDVIKTRLQSPEYGQVGSKLRDHLNSWNTASHVYREEGPQAFFRGFWACSIRAFVVNAIQWYVYEWIMRAFSQ